MRKKSLVIKLFLPLGITLAALFVVLTLLVSRSQSARIHEDFEENLRAIGTNSRYMLHGEAEAYAKQAGMAYHRVPLGQAGQGPECDI